MMDNDLSDKAEICECTFCKNNIDFELDDFLLSEIRNQNVVIFAGAGVSTENPNSAPHSLYTEMAVKCGIENCNLPFPELAQKFTDKPEGRFELLKIIQKRFDDINKFADLRRQATKFFDELSTMPYFNTFITTNWDRHFEDRCAAKPFVNDPDMRFWNAPNRKVLKIHGTIDDYSSLIITREDYNRCASELRSSLVGGKLKDVLNTHTCIFIGYSMSDEDFKEIFEFVADRQGNFEKTHYFVSPHITGEKLYPNLIPLKTDGTFFLSIIKQHLCSTDCYLSDEIYDHIQDELFDVEEVNRELWEKVDPHGNPQMLVSAVYQDGLRHGYQLILDTKREGRHSDIHYLYSVVHGYKDKISSCTSRRNYLDAAYFRGYQNATLSMLQWAHSSEFLGAPHYFYPKIGEMDFSDFEKNLEQLPVLHKAAFRQCKKLIVKLPRDGSIVYHHSPWG